MCLKPASKPNMNTYLISDFLCMLVCFGQCVCLLVCECVSRFTFPPPPCGKLFQVGRGQLYLLWMGEGTQGIYVQSTWCINAQFKGEQFHKLIQKLMSLGLGVELSPQRNSFSLDVTLVSVHTHVCFTHFSLRKEHNKLLCVVQNMQLFYAQLK